MNETVRKFNHLQGEARELFERKNADYGGAFKEDGILGVMIRSKEKLSRLISLARKSGEGSLVEESIRDTLIDNSNMSLMAIIAYEETGQEAWVPACECVDSHSQECISKIMEEVAAREG